MNESTESRRGARRPNELEREADEIRADMDRTLDALERRLSPAQLLDRSLTYLREHGADLAREMTDTIKRNPVPALLSAAGVGWLVTTILQSRRAGESAYAESEYEPSGHRGPIRERVAATRERIRSSAAADKVSHAVSATRARTHVAQARLYALVEEQPIILGAVAVAVGAIIGAAIPETEYENRTVGQVRDRAMEKAKQMGERQYETLRTKLGQQEDVQVSGRAH
jgi:ElaB/YqjD/DUF883 family membrane-anchored ribosome-binding protein